jgi:hypothetical protein
MGYQGVTVKEPDQTRSRYAPLALDEAPEVGAVLTRLGLGEFDPGDVTTRVGRNDNWSGTTSTGARVFVKRLGGPWPVEARQRYDRILSFESLIACHPRAELLGPRLLGCDPDALIVVFELLENARSGSELAADGEFDEELCHRAGQLTAHLHNLPPDGDVLDTTPHPMPPPHPHNAITLEGFIGSTFGELEIWRLVQSDLEVVAALRGLREAESALVDKRPIHGDLRRDQFLWTPQQLYLTDWEELRLGDPARDVGAVIGEWLYSAVHSVPRLIFEAADTRLDHEASHEEVLAHGIQEVDRLRPRMRAFWAGYTSVRGAAAAEGLRTRAAAYAGWHMFDRMLATAIASGYVYAADRAGAGIGRAILLSPDSFADTLGLDALERGETQ